VAHIIGAIMVGFVGAVLLAAVLATAGWKTGLVTLGCALLLTTILYFGLRLLAS
jgi:small basic protein